MLADDLSQFDTFNEFFTRKLKDGRRVFDDKDDPSCISSPCDGTVYNLGDCEDDKFVVVKGTTYTLDEFLFGKEQGSRQYFVKILETIKERGNELKFILLYLSPCDYHRFHSPTLWSTNYRRHIVGKLHPVMPSYVNKHPDVFRVNERVVLYGEWKHGFFSTAFIGALNVGSITLNFDKDLKTNTKMDTVKDHYDKNYLRMTELEGIFRNNLIIKKKALGHLESDIVDVSNDMGIIDIKDIIDVDSGAHSFVYNEMEEQQMKYNLSNSFAPDGKFDFDQYQTDLLAKLEDSTQSIQQYTMTNKGIILEKGQEVG